MIRKLLLSLDKRSQCHTSTQVLMDDYCNQGKDDYSDIQDRALGARYVHYDAQTNCVCALSTHISA